MRPQGCLHWAGIRPTLGSDQRFGLGVIRSPRRGPFTTDEQRLLATLSEHLGRAGEIARRLDLFEAQSRAASAVLADLNAGVLLVDADMNVAFENAIAEALLIADDGLIVRGGRLRAATPRLDAPLRELFGAPRPDRTVRTGSEAHWPCRASPARRRSL
jgi:GAF domain-containing protein